MLLCAAINIRDSKKREYNAMFAREYRKRMSGSHYIGYSVAGSVKRTILVAMLTPVDAETTLHPRVY